ncbi:MAG: CRTAC1 family protein [Planctomycetota bacterium]|jgi:hypothetical protein
MSTRSLNKRYRLMLRWGVPCALVAVAVAWAAVLGSARIDPTAPNEDGSIDGMTNVLEREVSDAMVSIGFESAAASAGIDFRHFRGTRQSLLPEDMGSGLAWGDYDDDGDPDLFLVNFAAPLGQPVDAGAARCALYRNEGDGTFADVSAASGADLAVRGLGAAWGDYDGDGDLDRYVTAYGPNVLLRNDGHGAFEDATGAAGVGDPAFGAGAAWGDYDADGDLDLYVCNYVQFDEDAVDRTRISRQYGSEIPYTLNPSSYPPALNQLYRNAGDGTFEDVAAAAGVANATGRSLASTWFDFDLDGRLDLYVANDVSANGVFRNMGDGTFADIGASSLAADYRGAMGLAVGDLEHDGDLDLFVTHWVAQENALFENGLSYGWTDDAGQPRIMFMDNAEQLGLGYISLRMVGWATGFTDLDNDGETDLWVVNGNTLEIADDPTRLEPQPVQVFRRDADRGFFEMAAKACDELATPIVGRGGAHADYDGDGRVDVAIVVHGGEAMLLRNVATDDAHWLRVDLRQDGGNPRGLGAIVRIRTGDRERLAQVGTEGSYLSQHEGTLHFGLGDVDRVDEIVVRWPDGGEQRVRDVGVDRVIRITRNVSEESEQEP